MCIYVNFLIKQNFLYLGDIIKRNEKLKNLSETAPRTSDLYKQHLLSWSALISSIPKKWPNVMAGKKYHECDMSEKLYLTMTLFVYQS